MIHENAVNILNVICRCFLNSGLQNPWLNFLRAMGLPEGFSSTVELEKPLGGVTGTAGHQSEVLVAATQHTDGLILDKMVSGHALPVEFTVCRATVVFWPRIHRRCEALRMGAHSRSFEQR